jgi:hypothetical protein
MSEQLNPQPEDSAQRLARLDLRGEDLLACVRAGIAARRSATSNHPRAFGGWLDYGERIATLRETLTLRDWTKREPNGMCLVVHPEQRFAIMTALGTAGTGTSAPVTTRRPRGGTTERVVRINGQLELDLGPQVPSTPTNSLAMPTWVLLVHEDEHEVRSELSLARHMSDEGYIDDWVDRIPLPAIRINDLLDDTGDDGPPEAGHDFDVTER